MFTDVKAMLPVSGDAYDAEIILQINAAALDLTNTAEIKLPGSIDITRTQNQDGSWTITDNSTLTDALVITTIATWCNMPLSVTSTSFPRSTCRATAPLSSAPWDSVCRRPRERRRSSRSLKRSAPCSTT